MEPRPARSPSGLAYHREGTGPTVLLLHGVPGSAEVWRPVATTLRTTYDVVVPDLLGFGASDRPSALTDLHASAQAEALAELVDDLGTDPVTVVGHDFGGPVAVALAAARPDRVAALGLLAVNVLADTPIPFPLNTVNLPLVGGLAGRLLFSRPSLLLMLRQGTGRGTAPPPAAAYLGDTAQRRSIATLFQGSLQHLAELYRPIEEQLAALSCPTWVGWGDADPFFSLARGRRTAEAAAAPLTVYDDAGHFLPHERPDLVAADIAALAARAQPAPTRRRTRVRPG